MEQPSSGIALSVPEVRRLLQVVGKSQEEQSRRLHWSGFRRRHQVGARKNFHQVRRVRQAPPASCQLPAPTQVRGLPVLTDAHWEHLRPLLPPQKPQTGRLGTRSSLRSYKLYVLWVARTGLVGANCPGALGRGRRCRVAINAG